MVQYLETLSMSTIFVPHDVKPNEKCSKSRMSKCFYFLHLILSTYSAVVLQSLNKYCRNEEWIINSSWLIFVLVADVLKII